jgi:murein DD-endopeptidase MepM/ murein hydrolase activator NlpD
MKGLYSIAFAIALSSLFLVSFTHIHSFVSRFSPTVVFAAVDGLELEIDSDEPSSDESLLFPFLPDSGVVVEDFSFDVRVQDKLEGLSELELEAVDLETDIRAVLQPIDSEVFSLEGQLRLLESEARRLSLEQARLVSAKRKKEDEVNRLELQQKIKQLEIKDVFDRLQSVVELLYAVRRSYVEFDGSINLYRLLLQEGRASDVLLKERYLRVVQQQAAGFLKESIEKFAYDEQVKNLLLLDKEELDSLEERLSLAVEVVEEQKAYRAELLEFAVAEKDFFAVLLEEARVEQVKIEREFQALVRGLDDLDFGNTFVSFIWPVDSVHGISAGYDDAEYYTRFGLPHFAIDIPTEQLTPVRAAEDGLVVEVRDGGARGYSHLLLGHENGFATGYGHLFEMLVVEGETVLKGDIVAFSGGIPGTRGAGKLTTGAHLHFEVLKNGEYVDPEEYLGE